MRVLYADANVLHVNPTANLLPILFREQFPATRFFGPGFADAAAVAGGIRRWIDQTGPYDAVVFGPNTPILIDDEDRADGAAIEFLRRYTAHALASSALAGFFRDVRRSLTGLPVPIRMVSALNFDYYAASDAQVDRLLADGLVLLGPNEQFVVRLEELPEYVRNEAHFRRKQARLSDCWYDFLVRHPERVVTAVHFVSPGEFWLGPVAGRPDEVAIPGAEYHLRQVAARELRRHRIKVASKWYFHAYRLANRARLPVFSRHLPLRLYHLLFRQTLARTRFVYTARGGFGIPVRKYFEIPAAGAAMLCVPCNGFRALGFRDGVHYYDVTPDNLADALGRLERDPSVQAVASAGQELVIRRHSLTARGEQISRCLGAMVRGTFRGARWSDGEFVVEETAECAA